jgi:hypothetical protein
MQRNHISRFAIYKKTPKQRFDFPCSEHNTPGLHLKRERLHLAQEQCREFGQEVLNNNIYKKIKVKIKIHN